MRPTRTLGDDIDSAPLFIADAGDEGAGTLGVAGAGGAAAALEGEDDPALLRAALRSWGIIKGVVPAALRLTDPSSLSTSALAARKLRVYMTFSATYW